MSLKQSNVVLAEKNLKYILAQYVFSKRVFAPLIAIYLSDYAGLSFSTIGTVLAISTIVGLLFELPTGILADKIGRATSIRLGSPFAVLSIVAIVLMPNIYGAFIWQILDAVAFSFWGGAREALVHDSLEIIDRGSEYKAFMTKIQRRSLLISACLLSFTPLTYHIDPRIPLLIGGLGYVVMFMLSYKLSNILITKNKDENEDGFSLLHLKSHIFSILLLIIALGLLNGISSHGTTITLGMKHIGMNEILISWGFAASGFIAFFGSGILKKILKMRLEYYLLFDLLVCCSVPAVIFTRQPYIIFLFFALNMTWWRFRKIYYTDHLFSGTDKMYKASIVSALNLSDNLASAGFSFILGMLAQNRGILFANFSMILIVVMIAPLVWVAFLGKRRTANSMGSDESSLVV